MSEIPAFFETVWDVRYTRALIVCTDSAHGSVTFVMLEVVLHLLPGVYYVLGSLIVVLSISFRWVPHVHASTPPLPGINVVTTVVQH